MKVNFEKVILQNFMSFGYAELDLNDKGYCLVSGENHFRKDNSLSNGSGKSTIWSAISFALTGETIQGLSSNLYNINAEDNNAFVTLYFNVDNINYEVKRIIKPKSDLKIKINGEDKSGKTFRESEKLLADYLPDLTADLIKTTIIIGQGMPCKFSSFSPSGRKELLEKLSKSDFMIEDLKTRISNRQLELSNSLRENQNKELEERTKLNISSTNLTKLNTELENNVKPDFEKDIEVASITIELIKNEIASIDNDLRELKEKTSEVQCNLDKLKDKKQEELNIINESITKEKTDILNIKSTKDSDFRLLNNEINNLKSIRDICPTCGQKIPGVIKKDTSEQEKQLQKLKEELVQINSELNIDIPNKQKEKINSINNKYSIDINNLLSELNENNNLIYKYESSLKDQNKALLEETSKLSILINNRDNYEKELSKKLDLKSKYEQEVETYNTNVLNLQKAIENISNHIAVVNKMNTLIKRDFRGYLLQDVINFINKKAKEYSQIVFETEDLEVYLDGNALDISYCNKMIENLSGGEKQRVDLILQFAIRDMMTTYLNFSCNIIALDEIFDALDKVATDKILDLITNKLNDIESIFIISHHADSLQIPMDTEIRVIKNELGISNIL